MVYQRGNQREGSPHYVFLYSDDDSSDSEENIQLRTCNQARSTPQKVEVINVPVKAKDTLQALSLRFRCTISELKRINKIHKENEIHALRFIKVPVKPFSILTESFNQNQEVENIVQSELVKNEVQPSISNISDIPESPRSEINAIILNSACEPLTIFTNDSSIDDSTENDLLLNSEQIATTNSWLIDTFKCSGDDWGLSWTQLLGISLLLGFAGPIIYILYIVEFSNKHHNITIHS